MNFFFWEKNWKTLSDPGPRRPTVRKTGCLDRSPPRKTGWLGRSPPQTAPVLHKTWHWRPKRLSQSPLCLQVTWQNLHTIRLVQYSSINVAFPKQNLDNLIKIKYYFRRKRCCTIGKWFWFWAFLYTYCWLLLFFLYYFWTWRIISSWENLQIQFQIYNSV